MSSDIMLLNISPWYLYPLVGCWTAKSRKRRLLV